MAKSPVFREHMELGRQALVSYKLESITVAQTAIKTALDNGSVVGREAISLRGMRRSLDQAFIAAIRMEPDRIFFEVLKYLDRVQSIATYKSAVNQRRLLRMQRYIDWADQLLRQFGALQFTFAQLAIFRPQICAIENARAAAIQSLNILQRRFRREFRTGV